MLRSSTALQAEAQDLVGSCWILDTAEAVFKCLRLEDVQKHGIYLPVAPVGDGSKRRCHVNLWIKLMRYRGTAGTAKLGLEGDSLQAGVAVVARPGRLLPSALLSLGREAD